MTSQVGEQPDATQVDQALKGAKLDQYAKVFRDAGYWTFEDLGNDASKVQAALIKLLPKKGGVVNQVMRLWETDKLAREKAGKPDPGNEKPPELEDSPLTKALDEEGLKAECALKFQMAGYRTLEDLGDEADAVREAVAAVVPGKTGVINRICRMWEKNRSDPDDTGATPKPLAKAKIPKGAKFDLTQPTVKIDDVTYKIPTSLSVHASAETFDPADWMTIVKKTKALYGIQLDRAIASTVDEGGRAERAALVWKVPDSDDYLDANAVGHVESTLCYTSQQANLVHNRIVNASLSFQCPFASAAGSVAREEKQASAETYKRLYMTGMYNFVQAQVTLSACTEASPAFVSAIDAALVRPEADQYRALEQVFGTFGQVMPQQVTFGAQLFFTSERETTGKLNEDQVKNTVSAAVEAKYAGVAGGASASFQDAEGRKIGAQEIAESVSFTCVGGETTLASNPKEWASTVKDPNSWAIIQRNGLQPLTDWLDDARKKRVLSVWNAGLRRLWNDKQPPKEYVFPEFHGRPFTIAGSTPKGDYVLCSRSLSVDLLATLNLLGHTTVNEVGYVPTLAPAALPASLLADPESNGLLWKLIYTGRTSGHDGTGDPLYWIVAFEDRVQVANAGRVVLAVDPAGPGSVGMVHRSELAHEHPEKSTAAWRLTTVRLKGVAGERYLIMNHVTGRLLGPLSEMPPAAPIALLGVKMAVEVSADTDVEPPELARYAWTCVACDPPVIDPNQPKDSLQPGEELHPDSGPVVLPGTAITSRNGRFVLRYQADGNLALYKRTASGGLKNVGWKSFPMKTGEGMRLAMQTDGNLVIYVGKEAVWATNLYGDKYRGGFLHIRDSGEVVVWSPTYEKLWS